MTKIVEWKDVHIAFSFVMTAGGLSVAQLLEQVLRPDFEQLIIGEVRATVSGHPGDVAAATNACTVRLCIDDRIVFERPLSMLVRSERAETAELDERIMRLERMMNVLVEQDSPAGEALRRLGGAEIQGESITRLARPAIVTEQSRFSVRLTVDDEFYLLSKVSVRVSIMALGMTHES